MSDHTPTPWHLGAKNSYADDLIFAGEFPVCRAPNSIANCGNWPADGQFIVKAVNNHEMFERALRKIADQMLTGELELESEGDFEGAYDILIGIAREVLRVHVSGPSGSGK